MTIRAYAGMVLLTSGVLLADFSYQETSKVTGGMMAGALKVAGVFSKEAREPIRTTHLVKGNRMASIRQNDADIIDLDRETITQVDFRRKTYSVITFAEMAQVLKETEARMASEQGKDAEVSIRVSVEPTDQTKPIAGVEARLVRIRVEMESTDKKTGQRSGVMTVTSEHWVGNVPGYEEVNNFYRRMAQKLAWMPGSSPLAAGRSEVLKGMSELQKQAAALDGLTLYQVARMQMPGEAGAGGETRAQPREPQPPAEQPSVGGALGRLGGLGRLGRLGRKKESPEPPPAAETGATAQEGSAGLLMELTTEAGNFSTAPVDPSRLEVPAGFKQVESELKRMGR